MTFYDVFGYIAITCIFTAGIVPVIIGIIHYSRENKELDKKHTAKPHISPKF